MRIFDVIFGRTRPVRSKLERLFAMSTAYVTLTTNLQLTLSGQAGICFRPLSSAQFGSMERELSELLHVSGGKTDTIVHTGQDSFGFQWVTLADPEIEDLIATIHLVSLTLQDQGYGEQLLAAVFKFLDQGRPAYWVYNYKRGFFYPFVPREQAKERDNATELRLQAAMAKEMPIEPELERWYPFWGIPL